MQIAKSWETRIAHAHNVKLLQRCRLGEDLIDYAGWLSFLLSVSGDGPEFQEM